MSICDIIWPWGALRKARGEAKRNGDRCVLLDHKLANAIQSLDARKKAIRLRDAEIERLRNVLTNAHFRNPETGRIGKRGQTFD
jgi:hypothetical protein